MSLPDITTCIRTGVAADTRIPFLSVTSFTPGFSESSTSLYIRSSVKISTFTLSCTTSQEFRMVSLMGTVPSSSAPRRVDSTAVRASGFLAGTISTSATQPSSALLASDWNLRVIPPSSASEMKVFPASLGPMIFPIRNSRKNIPSISKSLGTCWVRIPTPACSYTDLKRRKRTRTFMPGSLGSSLRVASWFSE